MSITAQQVKELRERTGAPMMKCKKFLTEVGGDMEAAVIAMRKADPAAADKRADKVAAEGIILVKVAADGKRAMILEINCETDFVGRDENFKTYADLLADRAMNTNTSDVSAIMALTVSEDTETTLDQMRQELIAKIGEKVELRRVEVLESEGGVGSYRHGDRIGVIVATTPTNDELAKDIAMHIAASKPKVVKGDDMPKSLMDAEREIYMGQAAESGKPADIIEKMVAGRINKFLKENSLVGQPFVKDPNQTIAALLKANGAEVTGFVRYEVGEGVEKKIDNFAKEVMAQVEGSSS
jgi:elongation factor Ts